VVVGINLLREGLDIPEVSLVAVLDADKEGFLRSERSLIQTAGRAARNLNGKVIFYANSVTRSMKLAMDETNRRRKKQMAHNEAHGITPVGVTKRIKDIIDGVYDKDEAQRELKAAQEQASYENMSEKQVLKEIKRLEKAMHDAAKNLEFEKAAEFRDQLKKVRVMFYGAEMPDDVATRS
jgi:excinuclease ABC subunit B